MTDLLAVPWPDAAGRPHTRAAPVGTTAGATLVDLALGVFTVLVFSSAWVMFITGPNGNTQVGTLVIALFTPGYASAFALLVRAGRRRWPALAASPLLWGLMAVVTASLLWSINPGMTERRVPALLLTTMAGVALAARFEWDELAEVFACAYALLILGSIALALAVPSWGRMTELFPGAWRGLWNDKNALGGHMAKGFCLLAAAAALNPRRRWIWAGFAVGALLLIWLSWSKTALVTALIGGALLGFVAVVRRGGALAVAATFLAVVGLSGLLFLVAFDRDLLFKALGKDATLTGRTRIWSAALVEIRKRPLLGYGYQAVWQTEGPWSPLAWIVKHAKFRAEHAHNGWIETWLGLGYVGLAAWGAVFLEMWARTVAAVYTGRGGWLALPFLAVFSLQTLTESAVYIYNDFTWVIFTAILVRLALGRDRSADADAEAAFEVARARRTAAAPPP